MIYTEHCVTVAASTEVVFEILADVVGFARLFPPTQSVEILEEGPNYHIARLVVDVGGEMQSWTSRRDIDREHLTIVYRQIQTAPLVSHMGGEWRCFAMSENRTQLVLTHDFAIRQPVDGKVASKHTPEAAEAIVRGAVDRNSAADLAAVQAEAERRCAAVNRTV